MEENEIFELLNDPEKKIANWDTILTYFSKRMMAQDLNGLYTLCDMAYKKALDDDNFESIDMIYFDFFMAKILEQEHVSWRIKKHLYDAEKRLDEFILDDVSNEGLEEIGKLYFDLARHYEFINLAKNSVDCYHNAANLYLKIGDVVDASYAETRSIRMIHRFKKEKQIFPKREDLEKTYKHYAKDVIKSISPIGLEKFDPVEQEEDYLLIIDSVEEEIVRTLGIYEDESFLEKYYSLKKDILKRRGITWSSPFDLNPHKK